MIKVSILKSDIYEFIYEIYEILTDFLKCMKTH